MKTFFSLIFLCSLAGVCVAADSVDVVFRYTPPGTTSGLSVLGEFNGWNNTAWLMSYNGTLWIRNARLAVGGNPIGSIPGAWQYKFYYTGAAPWPNDPLNHHVNRADNDNSYIYVNDPTIYQFLPNQRNPIVNTATPTITAYIFPKVGSVVDTSTLSLTIDGTTYAGLGTSYDFPTKQFLYTPTVPLLNGSHTVILYAGANADTVTFITQAGFVQISNQFPFTTWKAAWKLNGIVQDAAVTSVKIVRNGVDTFTTSVTNKSFSYSAPLLEGNNTFVALADSSGALKASSPVNFTRQVSHRPFARIAFESSLYTITLHADSSSDPDAGQSNLLQFLWSADTTNPSPVGGVGGSTSAQITIPKPGIPGEYYFGLIATDPDLHADTTRNYFIVNPDSSISIPSIASHPAWARKARVYFLFPKAASSVGTINAAAARLQNIKDLGFSVIWMMPVMKNAFPIDNNYGPGYNIVDFHNVAPEYGTNQDFKNFVNQAHALGMKVILDVTPNHSSRFHPWSVDAHTFKSNSVYWNWYEHATITSNTNGLGDCLDADQFNYYCGFGDQLMNLNWTDADMRTTMIGAYKYWITEMGVDGYRLDVYWGPHRRYGEPFMGKPVRDALKHIKPDILLLGEDDGTGSGTETIYADYVSGGINGGVDAAYDFKLYFSQIRPFNFSSPGIVPLHNEIDNGGYYPGTNALYMRFMESQDEDRIVYFYSNNFVVDTLTTFMRTMPMASVIFTAPGFPMIWNGQEVGWGYGIPGAKEARNRSVINWNFSGKNILAAHYQKLAHIRGQFPAFTQHKRDTNHDGAVTGADSSDFFLVGSAAGTYAFARPFMNQNGLTVANFTASAQTVNLALHNDVLMKFAGGIQDSQSYYINDLYTNTRQQIQGAGLANAQFALPPFGTGIYTVSATPDSVFIQNPILAVKEQRLLPGEFYLAQNYPNPFNPTTMISFVISAEGGSARRVESSTSGGGHASFVTLEVYNVLGQKVATLVNGLKEPGHYSVSWNAGSLPSGVYFYRLTSPSFVSVKKMMLVR